MPSSCKPLANGEATIASLLPRLSTSSHSVTENIYREFLKIEPLDFHAETSQYFECQFVVTMVKFSPDARASAPVPPGPLLMEGSHEVVPVPSQLLLVSQVVWLRSPIGAASFDSQLFFFYCIYSKRHLS